MFDQMNHYYFAIQNYVEIADRADDENTPQKEEVQRLKSELDEFLMYEYEDMQDMKMFAPEKTSDYASGYDWAGAKHFMTRKIFELLVAVDNGAMENSEFDKYQSHIYWEHVIGQRISQTLIIILRICAPKTKLQIKSEELRKQLAEECY